MILYQSNTDNLIIEREFSLAEGRDIVHARYGQSEFLAWWESTGDDRMDTRIAREWIVANRWTGRV